MRALSNKGLKIAPAKIGPDYIDGSYLSKASGKKAINLDGFAFNKNEIRALAYKQAKKANLMLVEGVMGLFDGAIKRGAGSTADIAQQLELPIIMVVDCSKMAQSIAALIYGYKNYNKNINLVGVILNKVANLRHETMLRKSLANIDVKILGAIYRHEKLKVPSRHLGLTLANEIDKSEMLIENSAKIIQQSIDLDALVNLAKPLKKAQYQANLTPLGQNIAIAKDNCFAFIYQHILLDWQQQGAKISFFSPLNNEKPNENADAIFLPGGYPELYGEQLANAKNFHKGLKVAAQNGALIYGECGGFMVLGKALVDENGKEYKMSGLLPIISTIDSPKRVLGYRNLSHDSMLPFAKNLKGHEFHYSSSSPSNLPSLFKASDAKGNSLADMGAQDKNIMGSYAHIIASNIGA